MKAGGYFGGRPFFCLLPIVKYSREERAQAARKTSLVEKS